MNLIADTRFLFINLCFKINQSPSAIYKRFSTNQSFFLIYKLFAFPELKVSF